MLGESAPIAPIAPVGGMAIMLSCKPLPPLLCCLVICFREIGLIAMSA